MMSGKNKTNRTRGTKSIARYFSKITKEKSITQEAESRPLSLPHSDMLGVAGVAIDVGQHCSGEGVTKEAAAVNIISNSPNKPSNLPETWMKPSYLKGFQRNIGKFDTADFSHCK